MPQKSETKTRAMIDSEVKGGRLDKGGVDWADRVVWAGLLLLTVFLVGVDIVLTVVLSYNNPHTHWLLWSVLLSLF